MKLRRLMATLGVVLVFASCRSVFGAGNPDPATTPEPVDGLPYAIVDTGQTEFFSDSAAIDSPYEGEIWYGQDAQYEGYQPDYTDNGNGTVNDNVTGLMWTQSPDTNGDGSVDYDDEMTYDEAVEYAEGLVIGGYGDWRLPTIKELYSLIMFYGTDPAPDTQDESNLIPFIDEVFDFAYGDLGAGERIIDAQFVSSTKYVTTTMNGEETVFGVNFADGRIKGYGIESPGGGEKAFSVLCVRGNESYGKNDFADNGDGTITDNATGLMWAQDDSGFDVAVGTDGLNWEEALVWVQEMNDRTYLGYSDWRLPNVKELQSIVDYDRSPETTNSAAIDPLFDTTVITNEDGEADYAFYWSGTTHVRSNGDGSGASYVAFGRSLGYMQSAWLDVHGAGSQRSDPKSGDPSEYPTGFGPQGDAIRIYNQVRLVRGGEADVVAGGIPATANTVARSSAPARSTSPATSGDSSAPSVGGGEPAGGQLARPAGGEALQPPDLDAAAITLGVSLQDLLDALGPPAGTPPDFAVAAGKLGVTERELAEALTPEGQTGPRS